MHSKSDNIEIMINDEADEVIEELFKLLLNRYQNNLKKSIKVHDLVFNYVYFSSEWWWIIDILLIDYETKKKHQILSIKR